MTKPYINKNSDITEQMRTILVDWLIEVQENFALFHETLYLAVQILDHYLERKPVKREYLQLVGATSMLIASKFEVSIMRIISSLDYVLFRRSVHLWWMILSICVMMHTSMMRCYSGREIY